MFRWMMSGYDFDAYVHSIVRVEYRFVLYGNQIDELYSLVFTALSTSKYVNYIITPAVW